MNGGHGVQVERVGVGVVTGDGVGDKDAEAQSV